MDNLSDFLINIKNIRENEFKKRELVYEEKKEVKKLLFEDNQDFKKYKNTMKKKALLEKMKPGNISKKEYELNGNPIDILEDDIFNNNEEMNEDKDFKLDFINMDRETKLKIIKEFISRKNIILEEDELKKIDEIVDNPEIQLKKYFIISKTYKQITKIGFIKKLENGSYIIDLSENKSNKVKNFFLK